MTLPDHDSLNRAINQLGAGDPAGMEKISAKFRERIYRVLDKRLSGTRLARQYGSEDILQSVLFAFWRYFDSGQPQERPETWGGVWTLLQTIIHRKLTEKRL